MRPSSLPTRLAAAALSVVVAAAAPAADAPPAKDAPAPPAASQAADAPPAPGEAWRATRWGMTPAEVVAALPGEAKLLTPPVNLPDGNVVAAGIDGYAWEGLAFQVRFVFEGGKLALVSLRTPQDRYVDAAAYETLRRSLVARWGAPRETTTDDAFIDMRQTRWDRGSSRADLKYIPGVAVLLLYPAPSARTAASTATN
jgi:hypothetical protein